MNRISATEASRKFSEILNRTRYAGETFIVERNGEPVAEIRPAKRRAVSGEEVMERIRNAPPVDDAFHEDMAAIMAESRSEISPDPWED
jgi:prevent-host-death family protein